MNPIKTYLKSRTTLAFRQAIRHVEKEWHENRRQWSGVKRAPRFLDGLPLKLNLGSGPNAKPDWLNIDWFDPRADLQIDLRERWPFPDGSVSRIYSEHVFEHFEFCVEVPHFLSESLRVLKAEGQFDVGVPDTDWPLRGYGDPHHDYWRFAPTVHPQSCESQLDHINYHFRQGEEHKYAWDEETLAKSLQRSGFVSVVRRPFDPALDSESRRVGTLYMRASKPPASTP
jgi:predicted SAM-dependent methyltransferase